MKNRRHRQRIRIAKRIKEIRQIQNITINNKRDMIISLRQIADNYPKLKLTLADKKSQGTQGRTKNGIPTDVCNSNR